MELPDVGENCALETCKQLDFLPFKCDFCSKIFCQAHNLPESHGCQEKKYVLKERIDCAQPTKYICSLTNCKNTELTPVCCEHCLGNFCLKHRHQVDHECPKYSPVKNPMAEAAAKVEALTKGLASKPKQTKLNPKNEKLAAKIQLMKLKGRASGKESIAVEDRVFFSVVKPVKFSTGEEEAVPVFVSRLLTVGRAIDDIAELAKVPNANNVPKAPQLALFRASNKSLVGPLTSSLKQLLEAELLHNGQTLLLELVNEESRLHTG